MNASARIGFYVIGAALLLAAECGRAQEAPDVDTLIAQLASHKPSEREAAAAALREMGGGARAALERAASSPDPAIALQARGLLRDLPWHEAEDPQAVRVLVKRYRERPAAERVVAVDEIGALKTSEAGIALLRILQQESSEPVRWRIYELYRQRGREDDRRLLRTIDQETKNTALLAAVAWAWQREDADRTLALYRQVMRLEGERPTQTVAPPGAEGMVRLRRVRIGGVEQIVELGPRQMEELPLAAVVRWLQQAAIERQDWALLADTWRQFARHLHGSEQWRQRAVQMLFTMHARFGPLPGLAGDLREHEAHLRSAVDGYVLAAVARRVGLEWTARELERAAFGQTHGQALQRLEVARLLLQDHWLEPAEREVVAALTEPLPADANPDLERLVPALGHMTLAYIAGMWQEDARAAVHLERALAVGQGLPDMALRPLAPGVGGGVDAAREALHWRRMRAAAAAGNEAEVLKQLETLVGLWPKDPDVLFDVTEALRSRGRAEEASQLAVAAIRPLRERVGEPTTPNEMNELAWMYVRTGERLEEARGLARRAVEMEPDNAAFLDTLAEAEFRLGNAAEAVKLEERALRLAPGMPFMEMQLRRYRGAMGE